MLRGAQDACSNIQFHNESEPVVVDPAPTVALSQTIPATSTGLWISLRVATQEYAALVDTGACTSLLSAHTAAACGVPIQPVISLPLYSATGAPLELVGHSRVVWTSGSTPYEWIFTVVAHLAHPFILGLDFLSYHQATVDLPASKLCFSDRPPLQLHSERPHPIVHQLAAPVSYDDRDAADWPNPQLRDHADIAGQLEERVHKTASLSTAEQVIVTATLHRHLPSFTNTPKAPAAAPATAATIPTEDARPIRQPQRRFSPADIAIIKGEVDAMLLAGIVVPSHSPWASPVVLANKPDGTKRFCIDYRPLNEVTIGDAFPLPRIDDTLDRLGGASYFSKIDLASGYWQVPMDLADRAKTAFTTPFGLYEFTRMPFGLKNAPASFQRLMTEVLGTILYEFGLVYIDDIIVFSATFEEHMAHLEQILNRLEQFGLHARISKSEFAVPSLLYLGYIVSKDGLLPNPAKTAAIQTLTAPQAVPELRRFLGMTGYYRSFIQDYSHLAEPLIALSRGNIIWEWTPACQLAFQTLRDRLSSAPVLAYPDWGKPFILQTDASDVAIGAILAQLDSSGKERPVAYASRTLTPAERNYSATDRECLAVVWGVALHRPYLHGRLFTIITDHQALTWLQRMKDPTGRLARWLLTLQEYTFTIVHKPGRRHANADYLSRVIGAINMAPTPASWQDELVADQRADPTCREYFDYLETGDLPPDRRRIRAIISVCADMFLDDHGILCYNPSTGAQTARIVLPASLRTDTLFEAHDIPTAGHLGSAKTWAYIRERYFWEGLHADVKSYVDSCRKCQEKSTPRRPAPGPLQPLPPSSPWDTVAIDIFGPLPISDTGRRYIVVHTDLFTKYIVATALITQDAESVAKAFVDNVVCVHGCPRALLSDRGTNFTSALLRRVTDLLGIKRLFTTAYHPQTDGQVERFMSTLQQMLSKFCAENQRDWDIFLQQLIFAYNSRVHATTGLAPFNLLYGRSPSAPGARRPTALQESTNIDDYASRLAAVRATSFDIATAAIKLSQQHQIERHDPGHPSSTFKTGDLVMLNHPSRTRGLSPKLQRPWRGPYKVVAFGISPTTVRLATPIGAPLKNLVNLSRLKSYHVRHESHEIDNASDEISLADDEFIVESILDHRARGRGRQYLVRWLGYDSTHDSWEPSRNINPDLLASYNLRPRTAST